MDSQKIFAPSSTNLFVRNLPVNVDDSMIKSIFSRYGTITSSMVMRDIHSGQSLGTAFVRYACHTEAQQAIQAAQGIIIDGVTVHIEWARQQHDTSPAGDARNKVNKLFLRNIPMNIGTEELTRVLRSYGTVVNVSLHRDTAPVADRSEQRRIVFVTFAEEGAADRALLAVHNTCAFPECNGVPLMAKLIRDSFKPKKSSRRSKGKKQSFNNEAPPPPYSDDEAEQQGLPSYQATVECGPAPRVTVVPRPHVLVRLPSLPEVPVTSCKEDISNSCSTAKEQQGCSSSSSSSYGICSPARYCFNPYSLDNNKVWMR